LASAGKIEIRVQTGPQAEEFARATAQAHRDVKRVRQDIRHLDRSLAILLEATHRLFGIEYTKGD
jgi:hypothetical protein